MGRHGSIMLSFTYLVVIQQVTTACLGMQEPQKGSLGCIPGGTHRKGTHKEEEAWVGWGYEGASR